MKTLQITVANKIATFLQRGGGIVCGNSDYQIKFTFDAEWDEHAQKTARFIWSGQYYDTVFEGDTCPVPVIRNATQVKVGVYAGNLTTTTSAKIPATPSILCAGAKPSTEDDRNHASEAKAAADRAEAAADRAAKDAVEAAAETVEALVGELGIVQSLGDSSTAVVSQKAATDSIGKVVLRANDFTWQQGSLSNTSMKPYSDKTRIVSNPIDVGGLVDRDVQFLYDRTSFDLLYKTYDENQTFIADTGWLENGGTFDTYNKVTLADNVRYIMVLIRYKANGEILPDAETGFAFIRGLVYKELGSNEKSAVNQNLVTDIIDSMNGGIVIGWAGNKGGLTYTANSNGSMVVHFPNKLIFRFKGVGTQGLDWADITSEISQYTTINGNSADITIPSFANWLVYDRNTNKLKMHNYQNDTVAPGNVVLIVNDYGHPCGGELMRLFDYKRFQNLEDDVAKAKSDIESVKAELPEETRNTVINFASLLHDASTNIEPFIFFTDPHLCQFNGMAWRAEFDQYMRHLKNVFDEAPVERVICGGDWIGNGEYRWEVCHRLGLVESTMRANFGDKYHLVVGNHDTNYQGKIDANSETGTGRVSNEAIINFWGRKYGRLYYKVESVNTDFYLLDTNAPDNDTDMNWDAAYHESQLLWLAEELQTNTRENIAIIGHIFGANDNGWLFPFVNKLPNIIEAFNNRSSITIGGQSFNYANATGRIRFCMSGHTHNDIVNTIGGVPFVRTTHMREGGTPTYDLCLADYGANKLHLVRIGTGEDRTIDI